MLVPPISKPIIPLNSVYASNKAWPVAEYPITPPAGPLKIDLLPLKSLIDDKPPSDYMKNIFIFKISSSNPETNWLIYVTTLL